MDADLPTFQGITERPAGRQVDTDERQGGEGWTSHLLRFTSYPLFETNFTRICLIF